MTQNEVLSELLKHNVDLSVRTLQRYSSCGLIQTPKITRLGRAGGTKADYEPNVPAEAYAAYKLLRDKKFKADPQTIKKIREIALYIEQASYEYNSWEDFYKDKKLKIMIKNQFEGLLIAYWLWYKFNFIYNPTGNKDLLNDFLKSKDAWKNALEIRDYKKVKTLKKESAEKYRIWLLTDDFLGWVMFELLTGGNEEKKKITREL